MRPKKPELQDFGISPEEYALYTRRGNEELSLRLVLLLLVVVPATAVSLGVVITRDAGTALMWGFLAVFPGFLVTGYATIGIATFVVRLKRFRLSKSPIATAIKRYEQAEAEYQAIEAEAESARREAERVRQEAERARWKAEWARREAERAERGKRREYWMSLSGIEFEQEVGALYRARGYQVQSTPISGDQGIDLVMQKDGETTVVQCKSHQKPVGPAVARELFGAMVAVGADNAILACTGGFTRGVKEFVRDKPIILLSASTLAIAPQGILPMTVDRQAPGAPVCPEPGCGKRMILRTGRGGKFWGCPRYPRCTGTRQTT